MRNVNRFFADTCSAKSAWLCLPFFLFFFGSVLGGPQSSTICRAVDGCDMVLGEVYA